MQYPCGCIFDLVNGIAVAKICCSEYESLVEGYEAEQEEEDE